MATAAAAPAVTGEQIRNYRLAVHHLDRPLPAGRVAEAAGVCGVQNSPPGAWQTALFARVAGCTPALLDAALEEEKTLLQAWSFRGAPVVFPTAESGAFLSALAARPGEGPWIYTRGVTLALDFLGLAWDRALALVEQAAACLDHSTVQSKEALDRLLAEEAARDLPPALREKWNAPSMYGRPDRQTVGGAVVSFALRPCSFLGLVVFGARQGAHPTFTSYRRWCGHPLLPDPALQRKVWRTVANPGVLLRRGQIAALWRARTQGRGLAVTLTPLAELTAAEQRQAALLAERYASFRGKALAAFSVEP